jgi:prepilin-type N-terminal cleavage/methylation domain-containing protein
MRDISLPPPIKQAFSLVELSIVLVILGLLIGGILSGQSLIRASELRSVVNDMSRYQTAMMTFRDKYFGLPGDITNATKFWGEDTASSCTNSPVAGDRVSKQATCNGNGDGMIEMPSNELFRVWQQLANAGLIEGSYNGVTGTNAYHHYEPGINTPPLRLGRATGVSFFWMGAIGASAPAPWLFEGNYANSLMYGGCGGMFECIDPFLKPEEAWNIDTKLDDGKPGLGTIVTRTNTSINCNSSSGNGPGEAAAATYMLEQSGANCALYQRGL